MRPKHNFAYITGTNRNDDIPIIKSLIKQARAVGVTEDIHVFAPLPVADCIYHQFSGDWRNHMAKLDFARTFADSNYDAVIWLDSDTWFVRDPGNVAETLLRGNKCWTSSEGEITAGNVRFGDWWSIPIANGRLAEVFRSYGCGERCWNTNGGMWVIRRDAIPEFTDKCERIFNDLRPAHPTMSDEPPLAITCQSMIADPELNTVEHAGNVWACDWRGVFQNSAPTGQPWEYEDWLTGQKTMVTPAIVHCLRLKGHMKAIAQEPVVEAPPMWIRGLNFASAMTRWTAAGFPRRSKEEINERLNICQGCDFFQNQICTQCGCPANEKTQILNKLTIATETCPVGKWA